MVGLIPGLILGRVGFERDAHRLLVAAGTLGLTAWVVWAGLAHLFPLMIQSRLYFGFFPALSLLAVGGLTSMGASQIGSLRLQVLFSALVGLVLVLEACAEGLNFGRNNPVPVLVGRETESQYLADELGWYEPAMEAVNSLPLGSRVVFLWEARGYYCTSDCLPDEIIDRWWHLLRVEGDSRSVVDGWRAQGVTHVLVYDEGARLEKAEAPLYRPSDWEQLRSLEQTQLTLVSDFGGVYSLYRIPAQGSPQ
jgi:hypothetical protein